MFYTPKERIDIGRLVFTREITKEDAAKEYDVTIPRLCILLIFSLA